MRRKRTPTLILFAFAFFGIAAPSNAAAQASEGKAPTTADRRETEGWQSGNDNGTVFRYPKGWKVRPILWQSAAAQGAGEAPTKIGITISPLHSSDDTISYGGRGASCEMFPPPCKCYELYDTLYTCSNDPEKRRIFDLLITTVKNESPAAYFTVVFPPSQASLHPKHRYTIRWQTKPGTPAHNVDITIRDTSKPNERDATVLDVKNVPNTGRFQWQIPLSITSPGPYVLDISFVVPIKVDPPALSGGTIYSGRSNPFYIQ